MRGAELGERSRRPHLAETGGLAVKEATLRQLELEVSPNWGIA